MAITNINLLSGSSGGAVKELQEALNKQGYNLSTDGIFGANTEAAVRDFQKKSGLAVDGIVGKNTWSKLIGTASDILASKKTDTTPDTFQYKNFQYDTEKPSDFSYGAYEESDAVKNAEAALNTQLASKPGEYTSQWQNQLEDAIKKILNREKFSYDLNGDALYQQYKDKYIQQGKMAMGDAIGQASAMTGGYGNSYAQSVGTQAYQAQLQNLNDIVPELYQMAYDKYNQEGQDLYNQYAMLGERENADYGRYQDAMANWQSERDYLAGRYDSERNYDYGKYESEKNFAYGQHRDDVADWQTDRNFAYGQYADDKAYAYKNHEEQIAYDKWLAEFNEAQRQYNDTMKFNREQFDWQKAQANKSSVVSNKGPTTTITNKDGTTTTELKQGYTTDNSSYFDDDGNFKKATFSRVDSDGNYVFYVDGKEKTFAQGVNPYTGGTNKDTKNGTFSNGYQPNNVNGKKLSKSGITDYVNGVKQNVWKDTDGKLWIWDGTQNKYLAYQE
jgi:peptidoglycan hydrolase-like protein with peptidoglycan-binding domain